MTVQRVQRNWIHLAGIYVFYIYVRSIVPASAILWLRKAYGNNVYAYTSVMKVSVREQLLWIF